MADAGEETALLGQGAGVGHHAEGVQLPQDGPEKSGSVGIYTYKPMRLRQGTIEGQVRGLVPVRRGGEADEVPAPGPPQPLLRDRNEHRPRHRDATRRDLRPLLG